MLHGSKSLRDMLTTIYTDFCSVFNLELLNTRRCILFWTSLILTLIKYIDLALDFWHLCIDKIIVQVHILKFWVLNVNVIF